jgi:flagellar motor protein MotB
MTTSQSSSKSHATSADAMRRCMAFSLMLSIVSALNTSNAEQPTQITVQLAQTPAVTINRNITAPTSVAQPLLQPASQPQQPAAVRAPAMSSTVGTTLATSSVMADLASTEGRVRTLEMQLKKLQDELASMKRSYASHVHKVNSGLPHMNYTTMSVNNGRDSFLIPFVPPRGGQDHTITLEPPSPSAGNN